MGARTDYARPLAGKRRNLPCPLGHVFLVSRAPFEVWRRRSHEDRKNTADKPVIDLCDFCGELALASNNYERCDDVNSGKAVLAHGRKLLALFANMVNVTMRAATEA
jgi:hypothetical protein